MRCAQNAATPAYCIMLPIDGRHPCRPLGQLTNIVFVYAKER